MMMRSYRESGGTVLSPTFYRVYCGPLIVAQTAERLRASRVLVTSEGTAHMYVITMLDTAELLSVLGTTWQRRDLQVIP